MLQGDNIIRGNAVVNQIASLSYLTAPMLGGVFYTMFGLQPVMYASVGCFIVTAAFECFIRLDYQRPARKEKILTIVRQDFTESMRYIIKEQTSIVKMLLLTAISRFFVMGILLVGLPFLIRTVLMLNAGYYGAAESTLAIATIVGSILAGLLGTRLQSHSPSVLLTLLGIFMLPAGIAFLLPVSPLIRYGIILVSFCGMQIVISIFSIAAVSLIQQRTPNHLIGKVMAYTSTITLCVQPMGQMVYGFLFDRFHNTVYLVLLPTAVIIGAIGLSATKFLPAPESDFYAQ